MWKGKLCQAYISLSLGIGSMAMGLLFVWPSYTIPILSTPNNTIITTTLTEGEEALLGSLPSLGAMLGSAFVSPLIERFGRKGGSIVPTVGFIISWIMVIGTRSIVVILIARFLGGFAGGTTDCIGPIYVSEVASDDIRGGLVLALSTMYSIGMILSYFIGWYCDYNAIMWINLGITCLRGVMLLFVPESPLYLMKKWRVEDARRSLARLRGVPSHSKIVDDEIYKIKQRLMHKPILLDSKNDKDEEKSEEPMVATDFDNFKHQQRPRFYAFKMLCKSPAARKAFFIVFMSYLFYVIMGSLPVSVYASQFFDQYDPSTSGMYSVVFAVVWCAGILLSSLLTDKLGRRILLIGSSLSVGVSLILLAVFFQTKIVPGWVSVLFIMIFIFCYLLGVGAVPYVLMSELFCTEVQTIASSILIQWVWLMTFFITAVFGWLNKLIGIHGTFYIFAFNSFASAAFTFFMIPETKGLSNMQIQHLLEQKRSKWWKI